MNDGKRYRKSFPKVYLTYRSPTAIHRNPEAPGEAGRAGSAVVAAGTWTQTQESVVVDHSPAEP